MLAERNLAQTRELYEHSESALQAVLESWQKSFGQNAIALNRKMIDLAERNMNTGFDLAIGLTGARNLGEVMELQAAYWQTIAGAQSQSKNSRFKAKSVAQRRPHDGRPTRSACCRRHCPGPFSKHQQRRSVSFPNRNEVLTWHGYSSLAQERLHVGNEVALEPCSALRIASRSGRSGGTVPFNEEVPDCLPFGICKVVTPSSNSKSNVPPSSSRKRSGFPHSKGDGGGLGGGGGI